MDTEHHGTENASVVFIAACPTTAANKAYIKTQLEASLTGKPAPDFAASASPLDERKFKGYTGFEGLSEEAKTALGFYL